MALVRQWLHKIFGAVNDQSGALLVQDTVLTPLAAAANGGSVASVSNASTLIAEANPNRRKLTITNRSLVATLTLRAGADAAANAGVPLSPAADELHPGDSYTFYGHEYTGPVYGILSVADPTAGNVSVLEV